MDKEDAIFFNEVAYQRFKSWVIAHAERYEKVESQSPLFCRGKVAGLLEVLDYFHILENSDKFPLHPLMEIPTGLYYANGDQILEGDIVQRDDKTKGFFSVVVRQDNKWMVKDKDCYRGNCRRGAGNNCGLGLKYVNIKKVGTLVENPELLLD